MMNCSMLVKYKKWHALIVYWLGWLKWVNLGQSSIVATADRFQQALETGTDIHIHFENLKAATFECDAKYIDTITKLLNNCPI